MKKQLTVRKGIALMIITPIAVLLVNAIITLGIIYACFGPESIGVAVFGYFFGPFIFLGLLLVEVIAYWIIYAIVSIVKRVRKRRRLALNN